MHSVNSMPLCRNLTSAATTLTGSSGIIEFLGFLHGNNDEVQLVGYILKNATVLNELLIEVYVDGAVEDEDAQVGKELKFCNACFRLQDRPQQQGFCSP
ncbi:hypothetical protein RDABS01_020749, partial [Bienertia sinuspersici]